MKDREAAKRLLYAIGDIDDPYLLEAENCCSKSSA